MERLLARVLRTIRMVVALAMRLCFWLVVHFEIADRQPGLSCTRVSREAGSMSKSYMETFKLS